MPASYLIDLPRGVVFSRGWGLLTDEEILAHARALRADVERVFGEQMEVQRCQIHKRRGWVIDSFRRKAFARPIACSAFCIRVRIRTH